MIISEKSFVTCYDKDCEDFAELLMTLVSENPSLCNVNQKNEEFKRDRAVTSNEYVLTIGPKGSKVNKSSFCDCYSKYGIHIGFRGRKAWISCENFNWDENSLNEFHTDLIQLYKDFGMSVDNIDDEIAKNVKKTVAAGALCVFGGPIARGIIMSSLVTAAIMNESKSPKLDWLIPFKFLRRLFDNLLNASERRKQQYKLAVVLFYHNYINEYLGLDTSNGSGGKGAGGNEKMNF